MRSRVKYIGLGCGIRRWEFSGHKSYPSPQKFHQLRLIELEENIETICSNPSFQSEMKLTEVSFQSQTEQSIPCLHGHGFGAVSVPPLCQFHLSVPLISLKTSDHQWSFPTVSLNLGDSAESGYPRWGRGMNSLLCTKITQLHSPFL